MHCVERELSLKTLLAWGIATIAPVSESARLDAMLLLARVLNRDRAWVVAHDEAEPTPAQREQFAALCRMRVTGMPLAYVLGTAGFYGREFAVDARVLVPRPETEHLIEEVLTFAARRDARGAVSALDVGTGSGAIACTIAAELGSAIVEATDSSPDAIAVARRNAQALGVAERCRFHCGRFAEPVSGRRYDIVVANLPYVPSDEIAGVPAATAFEPRAALDGGTDGLDAYRAFVPGLPAAMKIGAMALLEAAPGQVPVLAEMVQHALPKAQIALGLDYAKRERYVRVVN